MESTVQKKKEKNEEDGKTDIEKIVAKFDAIFIKGSSEEELKRLRAELKIVIHDPKTNKNEIHHKLIIKRQSQTNAPEFKTAVEIARAIMEWRKEKLDAAMR